MKRNTPGSAKADAEGEEIGDGDSLRILRLYQNRNTSLARLGYLCRLVDRQGHEAERFNEMRLAAARYRANPTPANAVEAHIAARRYQGGQR